MSVVSSPSVSHKIPDLVASVPQAGTVSLTRT